MGHSSIDHHFTGFRECFVILTQSSVFTEPRKGAFNNPTTRQDHKPFQVI